MITISKASKIDFPAVAYLSDKYGDMFSISPELFNNKDIALQARDEDGKLVGFVWVGLMASNTVGYIDKVMVDPDYSGRGILSLLYRHLLEVARKRKITTLLGIIQHGIYHDRSAIAALKGLAMGSDGSSYTLLSCNVLKSIKSLGVE